MVGAYVSINLTCIQINLTSKPKQIYILQNPLTLKQLGKYGIIGQIHYGRQFRGQRYANHMSLAF